MVVGTGWFVVGVSKSIVLYLFVGDRVSQVQHNLWIWSCFFLFLFIPGLFPSYCRIGNQNVSFACYLHQCATLWAFEYGAGMLRSYAFSASLQHFGGPWPWPCHAVEWWIVCNRLLLLLRWLAFKRLLLSLLLFPLVFWCFFCCFFFFVVVFTIFVCCWCFSRRFAPGPRAEHVWPHGLCLASFGPVASM